MLKTLLKVIIKYNLYSIKDIVLILATLEKYASWLLDQRDKNFGWSNDMTADAVVALTLATPEWCCQKPENYLTALALEIELLSLLLR